ncbi:MAG: SHOCT domain-containing protein [Bacteroidia bacterium]|jgi:gas vesicle protein|nr:SHOCT domain-containing protein [Bacteroidia bacterium]
MKFPRMNHSTKRIVRNYVLIVGCILFSGMVSAQSTIPSSSKRIGAVTKKPIVQIVDRRAMLIDSLSSFVDYILVQQDSLKQIMQSQKERMDSSISALEEVSAENAKLKESLKDAQGDTLQSNHTNSILFIFNVGVGIFLLIALLWMFMKKKSDGEREDDEVSNKSNGKVSKDESFDHKLDRIQKLGTLRDKGLLTDEEFNLQKSQILGE